MENSEESYLPREIKLLVIHCSATRCNVPFTVEQLRQCHLQRGFKDIGYHFYITRNGELHHCRPVSEPGAHVRGFNRHSIGICYEGGLDEEGRPADTRTQAQRFALLDLLTILKHQYPEAQIMGHYQRNHTIFRHANFIGCLSADKIKMPVRKYFCFNIPVYRNMAEEPSCRSPYHEEYIQTSVSGNSEGLCRSTYSFLSERR